MSVKGKPDGGRDIESSQDVEDTDHYDTNHTQIYEGDVVWVVNQNARFTCCDCGLVHIVDFDITPSVTPEDFVANGGPYRILMKIRRSEKLTAHVREKHPFICRLTNSAVAATLVDVTQQPQ